MTYEEEEAALEMAEIMFSKGTLFKNSNLGASSDSRTYISTGKFEVTTDAIFVILDNRFYIPVYYEHQGWAEVVEKKETLDEIMIDLDRRIKKMEDRQRKYGITNSEKRYLFFILGFVIGTLLLKYLL